MHIGKAPFDFGELRSLLQQPPSREGWERLCAMVDSPAWEEAADQWLPYALELLGRGWPDTLRVWPEMWWFRLKQPRGVALVRTFHPYSLTARQLERLGETIPGYDVVLHEVELCPLPEAPPAMYAALARGIRPHVRGLELRSSQRNGAMVEALLEAPCPQLARLRLESDAEGAQLMETIWRGEALPALRSLWMNYLRTPHQALVSVFEGCGLAERLEELALAGMMVGPHGADALARRRWPRLERLNLAGARIDAQGLAALLGQTPALRELDIGENPLGDDPARWFEQAPGLRLERINVRRTAHQPSAQPPSWTEQPWDEPSAAQVVRLLELEQVSALRGLSLRETRLEPRALERLISRFSGQLERLDLSYVRAPGLWDRMRGTSWPRLEELRLHGAYPADEACEALASMELPALIHLDLQFVALSVRGAALLDAAPWRGQLRGYYPPIPKG